MAAEEGEANMRLSGIAYFYMAAVVVSLFAILWAVFVFAEFETKFLPLIFGSFVLVIAAIGFVKEVKRAPEKEALATDKDHRATAVESWRRLLIHGSWLVGFLIVIYLLGFLIAILVFVFFYMKYLGTRWLTAGISAILTTLVAYTLFQLGLEIYFYRGLIPSLFF